MDAIASTKLTGFSVDSPSGSSMKIMCNGAGKSSGLV